MQTHHSRERKKKPFLWIVLGTAVLLGGAFALFAWYARTLSPQVSTPVVARGKIPSLPPSPSVESPAEPSPPLESASRTEAGSPENALDTDGQGDLESLPPASADRDSQKSAPEKESQSATPPQEEAVADSGQEAAGGAKKTGASELSDGQVSVSASDDNRPVTAAVDELQAEVKETPESPSSFETAASGPSDLPATVAESAPTAASPNVAKKNHYAIQVGAYRKKDNADRQVARLREMGFDAYLHEKNTKDQRAWFFVRFGRFEDFGSADKALAAFKEQEQMDGAIVRSNSN